MSETIVAPAPTEVEAPAERTRYVGPEPAAQGGPAAAAGRRAPSSTTSAATTWATPHFVRSPYAHALIRSVDVAAALALPGRLRDAHRRRGRDPDRPLLPALHPARLGDQGLRARGRARPLRRRPGRHRRRRDARARARRRRARRGRLRAAGGRSSTRAARSTPDAPVLHPDAGTNLVWEGSLRVGQLGGRRRRGRPDRRDRRAPLRPLQLDPARVRRGARRVQPRHRPVDDLLQQPVPGLRGDHDGAGAALRPRQAAPGHPGHRRRLRQQDHLATRSWSRSACSRAS